MVYKMCTISITINCYRRDSCPAADKGHSRLPLSSLPPLPFFPSVQIQVSLQLLCIFHVITEIGP